jgi:cytoskeletal protein CcmA (bactofilin family)
MFKKDDDKGIKAFLTKDVTFEGKFIFNGTANIDCKFSGEIYSENGTVIIGESAVIKGTIEVKSLINKGNIEGTVKAEKIENFTPGKIIGKIITNTFFNQLGAIFDGSIYMLQPKEIDEISEDEVNNSNEKIVKKLG